MRRLLAILDLSVPDDEGVTTAEVRARVEEELKLMITSGVIENLELNSIMVRIALSPDKKPVQLKSIKGTNKD